MRILIAISFAAVAFAQPSYEVDVKPILRRHCFGCHSTEEKRAGLDLETYAGALKGGGSEVLKAGRPSSSSLYLAITHEGNGVPAMPLGQAKIPDASIAIIRDWIQQGLLEKPGGQSKAPDRRNLDFTPSALNKPAGLPAMPEGWPQAAPAARAHPVTAIAASPWAPLLAVAGHDRITLYNSSTREKLGTVAFEGIPYVLRFSRNGDTLLAAGGRGVQLGKVVLFDVRTARRIGEYGNERDVVLAADVSADGKLVALGGPGKVVKVFEAGQNKPAYEITKHTDWITALEFSPDSTKLVTGDRSGGVHMWESAAGGFIVSLAEHKDSITSMSWRGDGQMLATAGEDGQLILWDTKDGWPVSTSSPHQPKPAPGTFGKLQGGVLSVQFAPNGRLLTVGRDRALRTFTSDGKPAGALAQTTSLLTKVAVSFDGKLAFAGDALGKLHMWDGKKETVFE